MFVLLSAAANTRIVSSNLHRGFRLRFVAVGFGRSLLSSRHDLLQLLASRLNLLFGVPYRLLFNPGSHHGFRFGHGNQFFIYLAYLVRFFDIIVDREHRTNITRIIDQAEIKQCFIAAAFGVGAIHIRNPPPLIVVDQYHSGNMVGVIRRISRYQITIRDYRTGQ